MTFFYDTAYRIAFFIRGLIYKNSEPFVQGKTAFVCYNEGWCVTGIMKDIQRHWQTDSMFCTLDDLPYDAEYYLVSYYTMLPRLYMKYPWLKNRKVVVKMTHPFDVTGEDDTPPKFSGRLFGWLMNKAQCIFNQSSLWEKYIIQNWGVNANLIYTNNDGADTTLFTGHQRTGQGKILVSTGLYERKRPELLYDIVHLMPHKHFLIMQGPKWESSPYYEKFNALDNVEFIKTDYKNYPQHYAQCDVYLSVSILEGGPIPLVESMAENIVPVMSRTGMADDLIRHGDSGYIFELDDTAQTIANYIEQAYKNTKDIRPDVLHLDWHEYSLALQKRIGIQ